MYFEGLIQETSVNSLSINECPQSCKYDTTEEECTGDNTEGSNGGSLTGYCSINN